MRTNENQGKRPDQIEGSYRISLLSFAVFSALIIILPVLNYYGLLPQK
jgi:hypothetical protein